MHPRILSVLAICLLLFATAMGVVSHAPERAPNQRSIAMQANGTQIDSEIADLAIAPIDDSLSPTQVMRMRPFVLLWDQNPAFLVDPAMFAPFTESESWYSIEQFMQLRGDTTAEIAAIRALYEDPSIQAMIPTPALRAATVVFSGWDEYDATARSVLFGENDTGKPFAAVEFVDFELEGAVATLRLEGPPGTARYRLQINSRFANANPLHLALAVFHESLHGGAQNSAEEELAANILDTVTYARMLLIDPALAASGTELASFSNFQVYALLNSISTTNAGQLGIAVSIAEDVFVGPGLEAYDATSLRDAILEDSFYGALPTGGSGGQITTAAVMEPFPGSETLGDAPRYDEALLNVIDEGLGEVISRTDAMSLAKTLGLYVTTDIVENPDGLLLTPQDAHLFDLNWLHTPLGPATIDEAELELDRLLVANGITATERSALIDQFNDPSLVDRVPDPGLRAALLLLSTVSPWQDLARSLLEDNGVDIDMATLSIAVPAIQQSGADGSQDIVVNERLAQESLPVLAAALVEASLLESQRLSASDVSSAVSMATLAYADLILLDPDSASSRTWGSISRNLDLLALLNSATFLPGQATVSGAKPGLAGSTSGSFDVLPGLIQDSRSFLEFTLSGSRQNLIGTEQFSVASDLFLDISVQTGITGSEAAGPEVVSSRTITAIDQHLDAFLAPDDVSTLIEMLDLNVGSN